MSKHLQAIRNIRNISNTMSSPIELYDLGTRATPNRCWSFNVWKVRMALNYKKIPYKTHWLNHKNLAPTLKSIGVPEKTSGGSAYTVPTVRFPDDSLLPESLVISSKLEDLYPEPSLHLDLDLQAQLENLIPRIAFPMFAIYMPRLVKDIVPDEAVETVKIAKEKQFGMPLEEFERIKGGDKAWEDVKPGLQALKVFLEEKKLDDGPFIQGSQLCYADFILVSLFHSFRQVGQDIFDGIIGYDASFRKLYDACSPWLEKDD